MATKRTKSTKNQAEEKAEAATLPDMETANEHEAAEKSGEKAVAAMDDVAEDGAGEAGGTDAAVEADAEQPKEDAGEVEPEGPVVHTPNLVTIEYVGDEIWTLRETITMPYPQVKKGDLVVCDRTTAKWLTRKGMPFREAQGALTKRG